MESGDVFVISAPSGSGKTTICRMLVDKVKDIELSVSYTTRRMKKGETDGKDYHFVNDEIFDKMINLGAFLESANVYGMRYGTSREAVEAIVKRGIDAVLEIDIQGGRKVKKALPDAVLIGIFPPDWATLSSRLSQRGRDSAEEMNTRLKSASNEMRDLLSYDYLVVNDSLEQAVLQVEWIVRARRLRRERVRGRLARILEL